MPLDRSNAHAQENGNSGRLKLVLRLDKSKSADSAEKESPSNDRPKRTHGKNSAAASEEYTHYSAEKKAPKKHEVVDEDEHRPSRKRKSTMDSGMFDYSSKKKEDGDEEDEEAEEVDHKKSKKKSHRRDASGDVDSSIPTPPLTEHDMHSGFKLKLKLPKPMIPDAAEQTKSKKVEMGSSGKKRRTGEEFEDVEPARPGSGVKLKIKSGNTPIEKKEDVGSGRKPKPEPSAMPKRHSPPRREASSVEKREAKVEPHHHHEGRPQRPKPEPKTTPVAVDETTRKQLSAILAQLIKLDRQLYFTEPVTEDIAPQYFSIITHPMDFKTMKQKLKSGKYHSVESLQADFQLICNNCMTYNPATTTYAREAKRMLTVGNRLIEKFLEGGVITSTTDHKPETKKETEKTPTRQATPNSTPGKPFPSKPTPNSATTTPSRAAPTPPNNSLGVAFPISSGQLSSMQHPISTTPQQPPYPVTPPMRKPPAAYPPLTPPYSQRLPMSQNPNLPPPMRPPPSTMPIQKSMSTNSIFPRPNMGPPAPPVNTNAPPRPQNPVGKPGSRPPVVSMTEYQATQTQAMFPEQPKRKYVKLPVEEPPKPAPPQPVAKTPAKLVAKVGNVPLVSPANVPGSFVYSMYIPRFEAPKSSTETNPTSPPPPSSPPTSTSTTTTTTTMTTTTTTTSTTTTPTSPPPLPPPTSKTANGNTAINLASVNYVTNYVSVPSLHTRLPAPTAQDAEDAWLHPPAKRVVENVELMEEIAQDCLDSMDADTRAQMLGFFTNLAQTKESAQPLAFPKFATQVLIPRVQQQHPIKPIHQQTKPSSPLPTPTPSTPLSVIASITGNPLLDAELAEQMAKLDSLELTASDYKQLQSLQLGVDLSSLLSPSDASTSSTISSATPNSPPVEATTATSSLSSPPTSPPISPPVTTTTTSTISSTPTDPAKASKTVQEILDKNLENLWSLQIMQHERVSSAPSEGEQKLASQISDVLFILGTSIPPSMLTTKEAARTAIEQSGLITGKHRNMRV